MHQSDTIYDHRYIVFQSKGKLSLGGFIPEADLPTLTMLQWAVWCWGSDKADLHIEEHNNTESLSWCRLHSAKCTMSDSVYCLLSHCPCALYVRSCHCTMCVKLCLCTIVTNATFIVFGKLSIWVLIPNTKKFRCRGGLGQVSIIIHYVQQWWEQLS